MTDIPEKSRQVLDEMIRVGLIPQEGIFEVTDELRSAHFGIWRRMFPPKKKTFKNSEKKFSMRLAGLSLLKLNSERVEEKERTVIKSTPDIKSGFVYLISNESFPGYYKIGITTDVKRRLSTYQTYDPFRKFKIESYRFVEDRRKVEKDFIDKYQINIISGEWLDDETALEYFRKL